jgi:hypothetical protein
MYKIYLVNQLKPRLDPSMIDPIKMTGDENVSVVNRITGKKVGLFYKNF